MIGVVVRDNNNCLLSTCQIKGDIPGIVTCMYVLLPNMQGIYMCIHIIITPFGCFHKYARSSKWCDSAPHPAQLYFLPTLCPASNCAAGPSPWKNWQTCRTTIPDVVSRQSERLWRQSLRMALNSSCLSNDEPDRPRMWNSGCSTRVGTSMSIPFIAFISCVV